LPEGETVNDAEFFSIETHKELTKTCAEKVGIPSYYYEPLLKGCVWQDIGMNDPVTFYNSHYGNDQYWHSMCPKSDNEGLKNYIVKETIIAQTAEWYSAAIRNRLEYTRLFALGKLCHMVQDSYSLSHCWRRYAGDHDIELLLLSLSTSEIKEINEEENGKIWTFQDYGNQDGHYHECADKLKQINENQGMPEDQRELKTIGYISAEKATEKIMEIYRNRGGCDSLEIYLRNEVYVIYPGRAGEFSGESHPMFLRREDNSFIRNFPLSDYSISKAESGLWELSKKYKDKY